MIKAAIMGYGTVGSGVYEVIKKNQVSINKKVGQELKVQYVLDLREFPGDPVMDVLTHDFEDIIKDDEVKIVAEVMGGLHPAYEFTKRCLEAGKSVCTSNKELVAEHGAELIRIAKDHQVNYLFEASVGGGIPIIRPLNSSLTADVIVEISGILNGTTNYMLTKMSREGLNYGDVLKEAQAKGYAELHPEADVEGWDACRKIAILTSPCQRQSGGFPRYLYRRHYKGDVRRFRICKEDGLCHQTAGSQQEDGRDLLCYGSTGTDPQRKSAVYGK